MPARKKTCTHEGYEVCVAETRLGGLGWTSTVWCALCGAIGLRDYRPPAPIVEHWRQVGQFLESELATPARRAPRPRSARSRTRSKGT